MHLAIADQTLELHLNNRERLWAFHVSPKIAVPLPQITAVSPTAPPNDPWMIRAPGTGLPGVLVAGTFYSRRGREFWYVYYTPQDPYLVLDVAEGYYKRLVLTLPDARSWATRLQNSFGVGF